MSTPRSACWFWSALLLCVTICRPVSATELGLRVQHFNNTALANEPVSTSVASTLEQLSLCPESTKAPCSTLITGTLLPAAPGKFGFELDFAPPLSYPSPEGYARLWVDDHLLYPVDVTQLPNTAGGKAPMWLPLPPTPLDSEGNPPETPAPGSPLLGAYVVRLEYVCLAAAGCGDQSATLRWFDFSGEQPGAILTTHQPSVLTPFVPIPSAVLRPTLTAGEMKKRELYRKLQQGWGTFFNPSVVTWELLPEGFALSIGLYRFSNQAFLDPRTLTIVAGKDISIRPGLHSYDQRYIELNLIWRGDAGGAANVSLQTTVDSDDSSVLTLLAHETSSSGGLVNASDYAIVVIPQFVHGRAGNFSVDASRGQIQGIAAGLRTSVLQVVSGESLLSVPSGVPSSSLVIPLTTGKQGVVALSTDPSLSFADVTSKTESYREAEADRLVPYAAWGEVVDAVQTSLMWSLIYEPKEGMIAPVTRNWRFTGDSIDGDVNYVLFCWDGSFASLMLSLDALDLAISNLIQVVKMRVTAGFVPSFSAGTHKTRDRTNPPVTSRILKEMVGRWGFERLDWVVELLFDDLYTWNTWMWLHRREAPLGLLSWGSNPYPYAPDDTGASDEGTAGYGAALESGLDNGPQWDDIPFNKTGGTPYLYNMYAAGYTGMFLMDCKALISLATMLNRTAAATELQRRFDEVDGVMRQHLWNATAGFFVNLRSQDNTMVDRMAPTNFYPLLAGTATPEQVDVMVSRHLTNPARFAVWPSGKAPSGSLAPPPADSRPLVQWLNTTGAHTLCCQLSCDFKYRHTKLRYEGMGLGRDDDTMDTRPLFFYECQTNINGSVDNVLAPRNWSSPTGQVCKQLGSEPELWALISRGDNLSLVELELWWNSKAGEHWVVASEAGKSEAKAAGYAKQDSLGFVWPPPGTANATSRFGLPSISKDDKAYIDQNYWHGRAWAPMLQLVYWGLLEYKDLSVPRGAIDGLVAQSKELLLKEWRGYEADSPKPGRYSPGTGRFVYENLDADTGEGYGYSSEAQPLYSWGALAGFIGLQWNGYYDQISSASSGFNGSSSLN